MITDKSLKLFKNAVEEISGYAEFLKIHNFEAKTMKSVDDFMNVPLTTKNNYLKKFDTKEIMWKKYWNSPISYSSTSGSTGEPFYFPRNDDLAWQGSLMVENFLNSSSYGVGRTLVIVGFGMGVWIGGVITLRQFEIASERMKAPVSILPTGYNKKEMFKALKKLSPKFDQTIIAGYPPFIKEIVDEASLEGVNLSNLNVRFLFAAEAFTETFRDYVCRKAGVSNPIVDTLNVYGTADMGAMAYETPLSILVRRFVAEKPFLYKDLFGQLEKTPTLAQYNPNFIEFETVKGELVLTADATIPLVRYAIGDNGGTVSYSQMNSLLKHHKINLKEEIEKAGIAKFTDKHPFVFVYERKNMSITLYGINIYPEFIKEVLLYDDLSEIFTEKFTMATKLDIHHNQFIKVNLELQKNISADKSKEASAVDAIHKGLIEKSSEFAEISMSNDTKKLIKVVLWPNGHERYFQSGIKQKWSETV